MPRVPAGGLSEEERRHVQHQREVAAQVLKAAMAINGQTLSEMDIPDAFCDTLPKVPPPPLPLSPLPPFPSGQ